MLVVVTGPFTTGVEAATSPFSGWYLNVDTWFNGS